MSRFQPGRPNRRDPRDYTITLTCGHPVRSRLAPLSGHVRYGCSAGLGCGYRLGWTQWTYTGPGDVMRSKTNPGV